MGRLFTWIASGLQYERRVKTYINVLYMSSLNYIQFYVVLGLGQ